MPRKENDDIGTVVATARNLKRARRSVLRNHGHRVRYRSSAGRVLFCLFDRQAPRRASVCGSCRCVGRAGGRLHARIRQSRRDRRPSRGYAQNARTHGGASIRQSGGSSAHHRRGRNKRQIHGCVSDPQHLADGGAERRVARNDVLRVRGQTIAVRTHDAGSGAAARVVFRYGAQRRARRGHGSVCACDRASKVGRNRRRLLRIYQFFAGSFGLFRDDGRVSTVQDELFYAAAYAQSGRKRGRRSRQTIVTGCESAEFVVRVG